MEPMGILSKILAELLLQARVSNYWVFGTLRKTQLLKKSPGRAFSGPKP